MILAVFAGCTTRVSAQPADTVSLLQLYERSVDFSEEKIDSLPINARWIEALSDQWHFDKGKAMAYRLHGLYFDLKGDYNVALKYYLDELQVARELNLLDFELSAVSDLAILYSQLKNPVKALEMYRSCVLLTEKFGTVSELILCYGNIGALYNDLNKPDSALHYLSLGRSLSERNRIYTHMELLYNNTGNVYYRKGQYSRALTYFLLNRASNIRENDLSDLWLDELNIGDSYLQLNQYDSARQYITHSLELAQQLHSKSKEADSYAMLARLEEKTGHYELAYEYQKAWYERDTSLVNAASNRTIAELQEKFHATEREKVNQQLMADVQQEKIRNVFLTYLTIAAVVIGLLVGVFLMAYRVANRRLKETNQVIERQKEKLVELNEEKNSLISIVSHDLAAPFSSIQVWSQLLADDASGQEKKAAERIRDSAKSGEQLIQRILEVERVSMGEKQLHLVEADVLPVLQQVVNSFEMLASAKQIRIQFEPPAGELRLLIDVLMLRQIMENLLSNAIKFSERYQTVWLRVEKSGDRVNLSVIDQGPGISPAEQRNLFARYGMGAAKPTGEEVSNGLGLYIVKRLVQELNGTIVVQSAEGAGAAFTVSFPLL